MKDNPLYALIGLIGLIAVGLVGWQYDPAEIQRRVDRLVSRAEQAEVENWVGAEGDDRPSASTLYREALEIAPNNVPLLARVGRKSYLRQEYEVAAKHWSHAVSLDPENASLRNDLGLALGKLKKYEQGITHLQEATRLNPDKQRFANNLASLLVDNGQDSEAELAFRKAHEKPSVVHFNLAYLYSQRGRLDEAKRHVEIALADDPELGRALRLRDELTVKMR